MNEQRIKSVMNEGFTREVAIRLLSKLEAEIAEEVVQEIPRHIYICRVSKVNVKEGTLKDGTKSATETFELSSLKKVSTFHRGEMSHDNSNLEGKRVAFIITKQRLNQFSNDIEFSGYPASIEELKEILAIFQEMAGTNGNDLIDHKLQHPIPIHIEKPELKTISTPPPIATEGLKSTTAIPKKNLIPTTP